MNKYLIISESREHQDPSGKYDIKDKYYKFNINELDGCRIDSDDVIYVFFKKDDIFAQACAKFIVNDAKECVMMYHVFLKAHSGDATLTITEGKPVFDCTLKSTRRIRCGGIKYVD